MMHVFNYASPLATALALNPELREYLALQKTKTRVCIRGIHPPERGFMARRITSWVRQKLSAAMPRVAYGHAVQPLLMFPTAAADYLEYERFHLVDAIKP